MTPSESKTLPYEEAAEPVEVTATYWKCKTCQRLHPTAYGARWCHGKDQPCEKEGCTGRAKQCRTTCDGCQDLQDRARYDARPKKAWDGEQMVYSEATNEYYTSPDDYLEIVDGDMERSFEEGLTAEKLLDEGMLVLCERMAYREFSASEYFCSDISTEDEIDDSQFTELNAYVNDWMKQHGPRLWTPGKFALLIESPKQPTEEVQ